MNNKDVRVLIVGETTVRIHTHYKGLASYETAYTTLSLDPFLTRFGDTRIAFTFMPNHEVPQRFPSTMEELAGFDVVVISDAPADSFLLHPETMAGSIRPNRLKLIGEFIRAGGGFLMIGGWMSFGGFQGKAHYAYSPLADILPVVIDRSDDRMEIPEGAHPRALLPDHPILRGLPADWPDFLGYNRVEARGGETILAFPNGDPLLVVDTLGSGRLGCFTSDILPHWGSPRFLEWPGYVPFWESLLLWLARRQ